MYIIIKFLELPPVEIDFSHFGKHIYFGATYCFHDHGPAYTKQEAAAAQVTQ
jgi:hypothetical protein